MQVGTFRFRPILLTRPFGRVALRVSKPQPFYNTCGLRSRGKFEESLGAVKFTLGLPRDPWMNRTFCSLRRTFQ